MQSEGLCKRITARALVFVLSIALVFTMMPLGNRSITYAEEGGLVVQTPVFVATGTGLVGESYTAASVSNEKSWTLGELKGLEGVENEMYSAKKRKTPYTKSYNMVTGVKVSSLIGDLNQFTDVCFLAPDGYAASFKSNAEAYDYESPGTENVAGLADGRWYYDGFDTNNPTNKVPAVIAWAYDSTTGINQQPPDTKPTAAVEQDHLKLFCGQLADPGKGSEDKNGQLFVDNVQEVIAGDSVNEIVLTFGSEQYTRADILMMPFAERTYTYNTSGGQKTDSVRGVPFSVLLDGQDSDAVVSFTAADGYDMSSASKTVEELIDGNYMLAYEKGGTGIYTEGSGAHGFLTLYGDGAKPSKMVNGVSVTTASGIDFATSPYKHITNGGITGQDGPYKIDAITGATLTIEGPGMTASTPLSVKDLESKDKGCARVDYTDTRNGEDVTRTYEGVDLYYLLTKLEGSGIKMTDRAAKVTIKNRNRQSIATLSLEDVAAMSQAGKPALIAYGTSYTDGTNVRPFVFDGATGKDSALGNEDGCLKFVYDLDAYGDQNGKYKTFGNMAYVYVEEAQTPGFKHDKEPYNTAENSQYVLTVTGDAIGREINYTVDQLEDLVQYDENGNILDNGYGHRDEYSLANSSYWYVNSYEGVKLWSLLLHSGISADSATDEETQVTFRATDNYTAFDTFSLAEVADPDRFGFYEKNANDKNDGTYVPNESIREGDDVTTGDKLAVGYPVLVSYGVNEYPYVISNKLDGFLSGLSNDGGPLRIISGKKNYNHANGSNQAKLLDKIVVGGNTYNYSTHTYQPADSPYKALEDSGLKVTINNGSNETVKNYTVKDLEELLYGGSLTKTQLAEAKVKDFYEVAKNGNYYSDLYEGVNLNYFLTDVVELTGSQGIISFKSDGDELLTMNLDDVLALNNGYNDVTKLSGLTPVLAYAKNGYPLVGEKNSDGWVKEQALKGIKEGEADSKYTVQNHGGPLQLVFPRANAQAADTLGSLTNITEIEITLDADRYAHVAAPYDTYAENTLMVCGEGTRLTSDKTFTVADLEGKQSLAATKDYSFRNSGGSVSQQRYRGLNLYKFLKSTNVGLKPNADKVLIYADGVETPYEFTLSQISKDNYLNTVTEADDLPVLLAYGAASVENENIKDGLPLVAGKDTEGGYDAAYGNDGGPLKLIVGQTDAEDANKSKCVKNVVKIEVTASEQVSWNHSSAEVYKSYLDDTVAFKAVDKDGNTLEEKTYTVEELEAMTSIITQEEINSTSVNTWEGLNFWQLIQATFADVEGIEDPITINVRAKDDYSADVVEKVGLDGLKNGVKDGEQYVPVLLAYAMDGYPLASGGKGASSVMGEGYDSTIDNKGGPMRLMVHNAQGACIMEVVGVTVKVGDAAPPAEDADFTIASNTFTKDKTFSVAQLRELGAVEKQYTSKGVTETVRGVPMTDLLASVDITDDDAVFRIDAGGYAGEGTYNDISLKDAAAQDYLVAYEVYNAETSQWDTINDTNKTPNSKVRIYRNYPDTPEDKWYNKCQFLTGITVSVPERTVFDTFEGTSQPGDLPLAGLRATVMDKDGNLWIGTYGGGAAYRAKGADSFVVYNKASEPALTTTYVSALYPDDEGGVYMTQNASYTDGTQNSGVAYMKDGQISYFRASDDPATIPDDYVQEIKIDKDGNVWFGSFGGLTKYDPKAGTWQTWNQEDGFPAASIDNIEFDGDGGIWCGFYPESSASDGSAAFTGGFAYFKDGQVVKSYKYTSPQDENTGAYRLGDVWIRDIAVDKNGGAWVVASGSYGGMKNTGGRVWYVSQPGAEAISYTGFDLFGEEAFTTDSELRMVTVDPDGGIWFGTSKDGVFYAADATITGGQLLMTAQYASATKSWSDTFDNIYSLDFHGNTLYAGSSGGLATHEFEFENSGEEPEIKPAGDATAEDAALTVTGDALARDGYFSIKGIKNADGIVKTDATFSWKNSAGSTGTSTVQGATLENIFNDVIGMKEGAQIDSVELVSADGGTMTYTAEEALNTDIAGNKAMFIWTEGESKVQKVIRGQFEEGDANKSKWAKDVVKIIVNAKAEEPAPEPAGDATAEDAALTVTGDALARDGYFSIKGIKNAEGIVKTDASFSWKNSNGETGTASVQGATLENIFNDVIGMKEGAEIDSIELVSSDGKTMTYTAEEALNDDLAGNKAMFIWTEEGGKVQKVIRGQFEEGEVNKGKWAKNVVKIIVNKKVEQTLVQQVEEAIGGLPDADSITLEDADAILAARDAYEALSDAEKAEVTNYDKLAEALAALDNVVKEGYIEKGETLIDDIDFTDYSVGDATGLWYNLTRLESKLAKAESAEEAAEIYHQIEEAIANTKTVLQQTLEDLNEFPVEVSVTGRTYNTVTLGWDDRTSARAYTVYRSDTPNGEFKELEQVQETKYTDTDLKTGKTYYYAVVPGAKVKGEYVYGNPSEPVAATPVLSKPKVTLKAGFKKVTANWKKTAGANGYVVYRSTNKTSGFKAVRTITSGDTLTYANKGLSMKKTYYYKVKAYRTVDGKKVYSSYSAVKTATTRSLAKPTVTLSSGSKKVTVKAKKVTGASGYVIYRSTKKSSGFKAIKTVKKSGSLKYVNSGLKAKKTYYYKVRAYVTEDGKRIYSKYSTVKSATTRK